MTNVDSGETDNEYDIIGSLEDLIGGVGGNAQSFGWRPSALAEELSFVAVRYVAARREYEQSKTRGDVLKRIRDVLEAKDASLGGRLFGLDKDARDPAIGVFPNASMKLHGVEDYADVYVPGRADLEVAAMKKMAAAYFRKRAPVLFQAEAMATGLEGVSSLNDEEARQRLKASADAHPALARSQVSKALDTLEKTFQIDAGRGGRNQKVVDGLVSPPDWQMMNDVLDLIWPIENGKLNPQRIKDARQIVEHVVIFALGEKGAERNKMKPKMKMKAKGKEKEKIEQSHPFSEAAFSMIMSLRHQINTLRRAVKFIEERKMELNASDSMEEYHLRREERLDRVAFYPLLDWRRELERRLCEADYRVWDKNVRRVTGSSLSFPEVPRYQKNLPQSMVALKLIHALKSHSSETASPGKEPEKS